jgi:membrane fusion protein
MGSALQKKISALEAKKNSPPAERQAQPLFRPEVIAERQGQWLGTILLEQRITQRAFTWISLSAGAAILALLIFGSYTRKVHVNGWVIPQEGVARVVAPQAGVVSRIGVHEGDTVRAGTPLLVLSAEIHSQAGGAIREEVVRQALARRDNLRETAKVLGAQLDQEAADLKQRIDVQRSRVTISEAALQRDRAMRARDLIALPRLQKTEQDYLDSKGALLTLEDALRALPYKRQTQLAEVERNIAVVEQELAEAEARREIVITAPQDGTITDIQAEPGSAAQLNVPLMTIVPSGTVLQAQLFAPSRAIGFARSGQRVLLRYQAFPYQKYGSYAGTVVSVSRSAMSPSELTQQLAGLTSLHGTNEPLYRMTVALDRQTVTAYGRALPLQPGMELEADVIVERRTLLEWVFDPLFTLTGKWYG